MRHAQLRVRPEVGPRVVVAAEVREVRARQARADAVHGMNKYSSCDVRQGGAIQGSLAHRASRRMRNDELLITVFAGTRLRMELDRIPLWRGDHVSVRQLVDDFARYSYLPRLSEPAVLLEAIRNGLSLMTWEQDSFAYADGYDDGAGRYRGLQSGPRGALTDSDPGLLVRPEVARKQMDVEAVRADKADEGTGTRYAQKPVRAGGGP